MTWTAEKDSKLKDAVHTHGFKKWRIIAALVTGRTMMQCRPRWEDALYPIIDRTPPGPTGIWTAGEDSKLKSAVQTYGGEHFGATAALVPGRSEIPATKKLGLGEPFSASTDETSASFVQMALR
jgi:myb proto-oncogene protein